MFHPCQLDERCFYLRKIRDPSTKHSAGGGSIISEEMFSFNITEDSLTPRKLFLPQLPWLEKHGRITDFAQSQIAEILSHKEVAKDKQHLFLALSRAIPFYLPIRYHQMSCKKLKLTRFLHIEQLWDQAFCFLYSCNKFDINYMTQFIIKVKFGKPQDDIQLPTGAHEQYFGLKDCDAAPQTAAEFLLEPWILLQMPFQPVLLHQWAIALLAEALTFQKKISPIFTFGCPTKLAKIMENLRQMLQAMKSCVNFMFKIHLKAAERQNLNFHFTLQTNMEKFSYHLSRVLPILVFVTSDDVSSTISLILNNCLDELKRGGDLHPPQVVIKNQDEQPTPLYDFWFWTTKCDIGEVFTGFRGDRGRCNSELLRCKIESRGRELESSRLNLLKGLVDEKIINCQRLRGVDRELIMAAVEKHAAGLYIFCAHLHQYKDMGSDGLKMKEGMFGVINNLICLYADAKILEVIDLLTRQIFELIKNSHPGVQICYPAVQTRMELTILEMESQSDQILASQEWTWDKILADAKQTCGSLERTSGITADMELHPKKIAQHFQDRIRSLVYKIAEQHLTTLKAGRFEFVPEHQFVQYVLPCFVIYFLGLCKYPSVSLPARQKFGRFVDKLIASYEQQEYVQVLSTEKKSPIQNQRDSKNCYAFITHCLISQDVSDYLSDQIASDPFRRILFNCNVKYVQESNNTIANLKKHGIFVDHTSWFIHVDLFMERSNSTIRGLHKRPESNQIESQMSHISVSIDRAINTDDLKAFAVSMLHKQSIQTEEGKVLNSLDNQCKYALIERGVSTAIIKSAQHLSSQQLAGLFVFLHFGNPDSQQYSQWEHRFQGPGFPFDLSSVLIWCVATDDKWKIMQIVSLMMAGGQRKNKMKDHLFASMDVVKSNTLYESVLKKITANGARVKMNQPGEITFVPVKHCRWCGLIKVEKFRLCKMCLECPEYCDINYFCSERCETDALDSKHREEHARFFMVKLGFENY